MQGRTRLKVNDKVEVIAGKEKGRVGKVLRFEEAGRRVVVERINMIKRHQKSRDRNQQGQIIEREASIDVSNVMLVCPECAGTVRTGSKVLEDGNKVRVCRKCGATIETPKKK
jgi:large subunit ribosomal protein L24